MAWRPVKGGEAEHQAMQWCLAQGWQVVARNFRCKVGEIDLICLADQVLVFIEVRQRSSSRYGSAAATVTPGKQRKLVQTAQVFLQRQPELAQLPARFDVLALGNSPSPHWIKGAFTA
jgi:putative endonuclease